MEEYDHNNKIGQPSTRTAMQRWRRTQVRGDFLPSPPRFRDRPGVPGGPCRFGGVLPQISSSIGLYLRDPCPNAHQDRVCPGMAVFPEEGTEKVAVNVTYMCADIPSMCRIMESRVEFTTVVLYGATDLFMNSYRLKNLKQKTLESWSMLAGWKKRSTTGTEEDTMMKAIQQMDDAEGRDIFQEMRDAKEDGSFSNFEKERLTAEELGMI